MVKLRKFLPKDLKQVLAINQASFKEPWLEKDFEKFYNSDAFVVAEENGEIAGFAIAKTARGKGMLKLIAVNPDYRGKGVGKALMENVFQRLKEFGIKEVIARSRLHNETGCAFLKSCGFEIIETVENYYHDGENAYLMVKKLDG